MESLTNASLASLLALVISALPLALGLAFAFWPNERKLALMRPVSLAGTFAAVANTLLALANGLVGLSRPATVELSQLQRAALGLGEGLVPAFLGFACLTAGWLCVALGMRKQA